MRLPPPSSLSVRLQAAILVAQAAAVDFTEADDAARSPEDALRNLEHQVAAGETPQVIEMYEIACWRFGISRQRTDDVIRAARARTHV